MENLNIGIYQSSPWKDRPIIQANPAMARIFGFDNVAEVLTRTPEELYGDPHDREDLLAILRREGGVKDHRTRMKRRDGTGIVCSLTFTAVPGPDGEVQRIDGVVMDITEQVKAEEALKNSQQMLQLVLDNVPGRVFWKDRELRYLGCNRNAAKDAGLADPNDIVGRNDYDLAWRDSGDAYRADDLQVMESGTPKINFEEMQHQSDGSTRWLQTSKVPLRGSDGRIIGVLGTYEDITDRKQALEGLRREEARNRALFELGQISGITAGDIAQKAMNQGMDFSQSRLGYIAFLNEDETVLTMQHWSENALDGCRIDDKPRAYRLSSTGLWGESVRQRRPMITNDYAAPDPLKKGYPAGHVVLKRFMNVPVFDRGRIVAVVGMGNKEGLYTESDAAELSLFMDGVWRIVRRIQAEESLRESEERFRTLSEASFECIIIHVDGVVVDTNKAALDQLRCSREEVIGRPIMDFFAPESKGVVNEMTGLPVVEPYEAHMVRTDGDVRTVQIKARSMDFNGRAARVATIMDVTEQVEARKRIEELGQKKEEERIRLRTILGTLPVGVRVTDVNGATELTNDRLEDIWGRITDDDWVGPGRHDVSWAESKIVRPEDQPLHDAIHLGEPVIGKVLDFQRSDGTNGTIMVSASQIRNDDGVVIGGVATTQDITELRRVQKELAISNADLQQFAYVASHDLQAPLRMISSYLQLLEKGNMEKLDQESKEYIAFALDGAESMKLLIKDILDYSRVETQGRDFLPTDMNLVIGGVLKDLEDQIAEAGATVSYNPQPTIKADQTQMTQLMENLIGNAIKFRSDRAPIVQISATLKGRFWQFSVSDNGIGLDLKYKTRIFEMFQRLHTRDEYKGTGIGLAICKRIVDRHGGQIWVESELGQGTAFYFTIPVGPVESVSSHARSV